MFVGRDRLLFFYNFGTAFQLFLLGGDCCDRFTVTKRTMIMTSVHAFILVKRLFMSYSIYDAAVAIYLARNTQFSRATNKLFYVFYRVLN